MRRLESEIKISRGIYLKPAELHQKAMIFKDKFICNFGRIQALKISKLICDELEKIQDKPNKHEEKLIAEDKKKQTNEIKERIKTIQDKLKKIEG